MAKTIKQQAPCLSLPERLLMEAEAWESWNAEFPKNAAVTTPPLLREAAAALTRPAPTEAEVLRTMVNHCREPHCIGCYDLTANGPETVIGTCNECGHSTKFAPIHAPTEAEVEAAAKRIWQLVGFEAGYPDWQAADESEKEPFRRMARAALGVE